MAISTQTQNLNLIPGKSAPVVVHCSQGNVGDTVQFYLYDGDEPYYPTNVSIAVHGIRADGSVFGPYAVAVTSGSNLVSFELVTAMTSVNGAAIGELVITDSNENQVGSANFGILVEATPYSSSVTYEDDLSIYQRILAYVQSIPAELSGQIAAEAAAREAADTAEQEARIAADNQLQSKIDAEVTSRTAADSSIQSEINGVKNAVGGPLVATTAAGMTDKTKVYVYTGSESGYTSGHWYYWNGTAWTDGGAYQAAAISADTTLSVYGTAADAKYTGDGISFVSSDAYDVIDHNAWFDKDFMVVHKFFSRPNTKALWMTSNNGTVCCTRPYRIIAGTQYNYKNLYVYFCPIFYDDGSIGYLGDSTNANYSGSFTPNKNGYIYFTVRVTDGTTTPSAQPNFFAPVNGSSFLLYDLNNIDENRVNGESIANASIPCEGIGGGLWRTQFIKAEDLGHANHFYQIESNVLHTTYYPTANTKILKKPIRVRQGKTYHFNKIYAYFSIVRYDDGTLARVSTSTTSNLSGTFTPVADGWLYISVSTATATDADYMFADGALPAWRVEGPYWPDTVVVAKDGSGDFTKLIDAFSYTNKHPNVTVYVKAGTYDIIQELGSDYIANNVTGRGPEVGNGAHFIFSSNALVTANYAGSREWMNVTFSPINISGEGATFENMRLVASKVRYCVHDDRLGDDDKVIPYHTKFINCDMYMNNTSNPNWTSKQCIGGGLGTNGEVVIEGCRFSSASSEANNGVVSYHNSPLDGAKSRITIKDCYFGGTNSGVRFGWYGQSQQITEIYLSGNSFSTAPVLRAETADESSPYENMQIIEWNNEIRS